jgi:hypothetical protein
LHQQAQKIHHSNGEGTDMANTASTTAIGVFENRVQADRAINELKRAGFSDKWISVITQNTNIASSTEMARASSRISLFAEGAIEGALVGAAIGALIGLGSLLGIISLSSPTVADHPLAALMVLAMSGLVLGGIIGALVGLALPEEEARYYGEEIEAGHAVAFVNVNGRYEEVMAILHRHGGHDRLGDAV